MGKKRSGAELNCRVCSEIFYVPQYRKETARFCSLKCQNHGQYEKNIFKCVGCGKKSENSPSRKGYTKYCSMECRGHAALNDKERRKKIKASNILRRGHIRSRTLRTIISEFKEMKCEYCGYDEYELCLDMHHIDHDPTNNTPENISILCCMCHRKLHKGIITLVGGLNAVTEGKLRASY